MVHIPSTNAMYFIGGDNQIKNDKYCMTSSSFRTLPNQNEKRQEFASMQFNNFCTCSSGFRRMKEGTWAQQSTLALRVNEQIALRGTACARCGRGDSESEEVLILGNFKGKDYVDTTIMFNARTLEWRIVMWLFPIWGRTKGTFVNVGRVSLEALVWVITCI